MTDRPDATDEERIEAITQAMLSVASGKIDARVPRTFDGTPLDVLAFLVNATAEAIADLLAQLEHERREAVRAQDQLVQAAKLVALGELARGIAHELNQPLTVLEAVTALVMRRPEARVADQAPLFDMIGQATRRMSQTVDQVRTFARESSFSPGPLDPRRPVHEALGLMCRQLAGDDIVVTTQEDDDLPFVWADGDRLQQVLVNLLWNARDAVLEYAGEARICVEVKKGVGAVNYAIEDNGPGIAPELRARIFDPFFTTKDVGKGAGLGLSVSQGIVEQHGGELRCESGADGGARFVFEIPLATRGDAR